MISLLNRAFCVWLLMMLAESIHGFLRSIVFLNWLKVRSTKGQIIFGFFWVTMTLLFEVLHGRLVLGLSWDRIVEDYDLRRGGFMIFRMKTSKLSEVLCILLFVFGIDLQICVADSPICPSVRRTHSRTNRTRQPRCLSRLLLLDWSKCSSKLVRLCHKVL